MASFDPVTTATQLATAYTQQTQALLDTQSKTAQATSTALSKLQSALSGFNSAMSSLTTKKSLLQYSATLDNTAIGTATATATATPGSYPLYVEQLASSHQVAFEDLPAVPVSLGGTMTVKLGGASGTSFAVNLGSADGDGDGSLSYAEIARAINTSTDNKGQVTAMVMTVGGKTQMMLSSGVSGKIGEISLDTSAVTSNGAANSDALLAKLAGTPREVVKAQDAIIWMGAQNTGVKLEQSTNTLTAIPGVTVNLKTASAAGAAPTVLTVAKDDSATTANLKSFIDAYNTLENTLDSLTAAGKDGAASAAFASDAGVRSLRSQLNDMLRKDFNGLSLRNLGISADRNGQLSLDSTKLNATLATTPDALDQVFGNNSLSAPAGLMGGMSKILDQWTNSGTGQIKQRQSSVQSQQKAISERQTRLDNQYTNAYNRYLKQFTVLQQLQSQLSDTTSMLSALGSSSTS